MDHIRILLASKSPELGSELARCLKAPPLEIELLQVQTPDDFSNACSNNWFNTVIWDADYSPIPIQATLRQARAAHPGCLVYALFDTLNEAGIAAAIRYGATSFGLKSNIPGLLTQLRNQPQVDRSIGLLGETDVNIPQILDAFLKESSDSIWVKSKSGKYLLINPAGANFLCKPLADIIGKTDNELFPAVTAAKIVKSDHEVMQNGITQTIEDILMTPDGKKRAFQAVKGVWRNAQGEVEGVIGTVRDITSRKETEETLKQSEARFRLLVEGVKDHAIYMLDPDGLISSWNIGAERLQGFQAQEILNSHFSCFYVQDTTEVILPDEALKLAVENGCCEQECWQIHKDGTQYWANVIITPLYNELNNLIGYSSVVRDMTEQRQAEEALKRYAAKLEESNKELEQFALIASHDLQAPLRKVRLFSEMLEQHTGEEGRDIAHRLQGAAEKMQQFISDLLELSRITRKGRPFKPVDLNQVISLVKEDLELTITETGASITTENLGVVHGDQPQLEQLYLNLLGNSLKFRKADTVPHIKIKGEMLLNGFCQITVQDNGIGFKEDYLEKIFRPFERLHGPVQFPGTGMGLAICKKIIERHGGQITASSQEGEGATFIMYLPTATTTAAQAHEPQQALKTTEWA